ncbi:PRTRC system protein E [Chryseobacterium sp. 'Rf worker isolate 10']|uniref:PRTRC system protein E n=1 Tax=Chryseobacterium sp. 'Rf worker isolate 10' TaxID=2887348 RepID=UPI003D6F3E25
MDANFFRQIAQMNLKGNLLLTITQTQGNSIIVSVMLQNETCTDHAKEGIPPFNLRGTAEELDMGFFEKITTPMQTASGLVDNMEFFMKQLEEARRQSAMEKEKTNKEKLEKEAREKKYRNAMLKADTFEKDQRYRDAWTALPKTADYPEYAEIIRKRQDDFARHFAPDLFNAEETPQEMITQEEE